jgi:hypothetical protein
MLRNMPSPGKTAKPYPAAWSTPLPRPIIIPKVMTLKTLDDVRTLLSHIPEEQRVF